MTPSTTKSTRDLFHEALEVVRSHPLPPESQPAFSFPPVSSRVANRGEGTVEGLPDDICATVDALNTGRATPQQIIEQAYHSIDEHNERLGAFEHVTAATAILREVNESGGLLHGIPLSVKDVIDVAGMPTSGSSASITPRIAREDASAVARLRAAGATLIGKTITHEFALGVTTPQSHNPWDETRVPGGSSGGSAISIVTGMAMGSLGTDTRASIRVPAALSGLVGFKPSRALVPLDHWLVLSWTMDHFAPMARSVRDIALLTDVLSNAGNRFRSALPGSLTKLRFGYSQALLRDAEPAVRCAFDQAIAAIERGGGHVVLLEAPTDEDLAVTNAAGMIISRSEAALFHRQTGTDIDQCIPEVRDQLREAEAVRAIDYLRAMSLRGYMRERLNAIFSGVDILIMPTSKVLAPRREEAERYLLVLSANCIPWSLVDFPAISLFSGMANGLPTGVQLVAAPGADDLLISAAYAFERLAPPLPKWRPLHE